MPIPPLPDHVTALLAKPNPAVIACTRPDGQPVSVATWYLLEGDGRLRVNMDRLSRHYGFGAYRIRTNKGVSAGIEIERWHGWGAAKNHG